MRLIDTIINKTKLLLKTKWLRLTLATLLILSLLATSAPPQPIIAATGINQGVSGLTTDGTYIYATTDPTTSTIAHRANKLDVSGANITTVSNWVGNLPDHNIFLSMATSDNGTYLYVTSFGDPGISVGCVTKLNTTTIPMTEVGRWVTPDLSTSGPIYWNGFLYVPYGNATTRIAKINPSTMTTNATWTGTGSDGTAQYMTHDSQWLYFGCGYPTQASRIFQIDPTTMTTNATWTQGSSSLEYTVGMDTDGTYLYTTFSCSPAVVKKIYTSNMTTAATWTGVTGENEAQWVVSDATYLYVSLWVVKGKVVKIQKSNMATVDSWIGDVTNQANMTGAVAEVFLNGKLYVAEWCTTSYRGQVVEIDPTTMDTLRYWEMDEPGDIGGWIVNASSDDCMHRLTDSSFTLLGNILCGDFQSPTYYDFGSGLRFTNVAVPKNVTIINAYLKITSFMNAEGSMPTTRIYGQLGNAVAFSDNTDFVARPRTTAYVSWTPSAWVLDTQYQTDNISSVIQEIVNNDNWSSGWNMALFWRYDVSGWGGVKNLVRAYGYDDDSSKATTLHIDFLSVSPTVVTSNATSITSTTATLNGNVTDNGSENPTVTVYWGTSDGGTNFVAWSNNSTPTSPSQPQGIGAFYKNVTSLSRKTLYYFNAKATNSYGTSWGTSQSFTTLADLPTVTIQAISSITTTTAIGNGNITDIGGENADIRGICWNTTGTPTIVDSKQQENGSFGIGTFTEDITGLTASTHYYVRAFAHNSGGYGYSNQVEFTTSSFNTTPTVITQTASSVNATTFILNGNITSTGGATVFTRGFQWGYPSGNLSGGWTENGDFLTGAFSHQIEGLTENVTYYFRALATNAYGTSYGSELSFTTLSSPIITTSATSNITANTATLNGSVTATGGENPTVTVYWGISDGGVNPLAWSNNSTPTSPSQPQGIGVFYKNITLLNPNTLYYFNAKGTNSGGTGWGTVQYFMTSSVTVPPAGSGNITAPSINATDATSITMTSARLNSRVIDDGGENVSVRFGSGISSQSADNFSLYNYISDWASGYRINSRPYLDKTGLGGNTTYYYRVQVKNTHSTVTSTNEVSFTTNSSVANISNLIGFPSSNGILLIWSKASGSTHTVIRYRTDAYPTSMTDGTAVYSGTGYQCALTGLTAGQVYYFSAWGYANPYSTTEINLALSTYGADVPSGGSTGITNPLPEPTLPASMTQAPNPAQFQLEPFNTIIKNFVSGQGGLGMPEANAWELVVIFGIVLLGLVTYSRVKNFYVAYGVVIVLTIIFVGFHLIQGWLVPIEIITLGGVWAIDRTFT